MLVDPMTGRKNPYCVVLFFYKKNPARKPDVQSSALGRQKICDVCVGVGEEVGLRQFIFAAGSSGCGMTRFIDSEPPLMRELQLRHTAQTIRQLKRTVPERILRGETSSQMKKNSFRFVCSCKKIG